MSLSEARIGLSTLNAVSQVGLAYAVSSCEAELYSMSGAVVKVLRIHVLLVKQGFAKEPPLVYEDSSSAFQLVNQTVQDSSNYFDITSTVKEAFKDDGSLTQEYATTWSGPSSGRFWTTRLVCSLTIRHSSVSAQTLRDSFGDRTTGSSWRSIRKTWPV